MEGRRPGRTRLVGGTRYLFGSYDVRQDRLLARLREHRNAAEVLWFLRTLRMRYGRRRIYLIMDNLSTHWTLKIRSWAAANNVELVPTPTYASYLNRIECQFWAISEFVAKNADCSSRRSSPSRRSAAVPYRIKWSST